MFKRRCPLAKASLLFWLALVAQPVDHVLSAETRAPLDGRELIELELKHAETYYWFGMAEQGNMAAFTKGLRHLDRVSRSVELGDFTAAEKQGYAARIEGLRTDLIEQSEIAHDTLYGVFPLTRFLTKSIFADSISLKTFEVIDDPTVMASTLAARNLALVTIEQWRQRHQLDVVFTSTPRNPQLENESLYVFNSHPKFFVHNLREVTDALSPAQLADFQRGQITPEIQSALLRAFAVNDLLVVTIQEADVIDDDYFYILDGAIFHEGQSKPTHNFAVMGFSRDRNAQFWSMIVTNLVLLGLTYLAFWLHARARRKAAVRATTSTLLLMPLAAFAVGRCSPWFFAPIVGGIAPIPETLAIVSFWVPALGGAVLTVVPIAIAWLFANRLKKLWPTVRIEGRALPVFLGVGAGAVGYAATLLFLYLQNDAVAILIPLSISVCGIAFLMHRALDPGERAPARVLMLLAAILSLFMGAALFQALPAWNLAAGAVILIACTIPLLADKRSRQGGRSRTRELAELGSGVPPVAPGAVVDGAGLAEQAEHPRFQMFESYRQCRSRLEPLLDGRTVHLGMHGTAGSGLTSTAMALVEDVAAALRDCKRETAKMVGECAQSVGEPTPYAPFQKALAQHFEVELLATPDGAHDDVDAALGEVFQSVVPFAGILFPTSGGGSTATSTEEIMASIVWMLRRLAKHKTIVLFIDDVQRADDASRTLLQRLVGEFPAGGDVPIALIATSHQKGVCDEFGIAASNQIELGYPSAEEQIQILVDGIGLARPTADQIVSRMGASTVAEGGLFWLLQIVANLARGEAFVSTAAGFALSDGKWPTGMFIPNAMRDDLSAKLRQSPHYRMIIECAACACSGREFQASIVAQAIGKTRLELLAELDAIDRETSILYDVRSQDDVFAFQSSFMLDVVRQELRIAEHGPTADDAPQIIREHHARLGEVCEALQQTSGKYLYQVANHFYAAGATQADRGLRYCLEAAHAAAGVFDFEAAERFLERAQECGQVIGKAASVAEDRLRIACQKAHLTGQHEDHARVAEAGEKYLREHPNCAGQLLLEIAQVHYDAGKSSGDPQWFDRSLEIGRQLIANAKSVHDEAAGHHFVGISLPLTDRDNRKDELRQALRLINDNVDQASQDAAEDLALLGRVLGSLAEELSYGGQEESQEAKELFERRLQIYANKRIGDAPGLAKTHGGLGRLAFFGSPRDIATAREHFQKDLEISEAIGDVQGQTQMYSLLAACAFEEGDLDAATRQYQRSWELARHRVNQFFAGAGLLNCRAAAGQFEQFQETARHLVELAGDDGVPAACAEAVATSIRSCPEEHRGAAARELLRGVE